MARNPEDEEFLRLRGAIAPTAEPPVILPAPDSVEMSPPAGLPDAPAHSPPPADPYGPGADKAALEAAIADRGQSDVTSKFLDAATLFNKAGGGHAGDLAAPERAHRDDSFNDVMHRRAVTDQDAATKKRLREEALTAALNDAGSPETKRLLDMYGATTVGKAMLGRMAPEQRSRLTGNMLPGAKEMLQSDTELMKEQLKAGAKGAGVGGTVDTIADALAQSYPKEFGPIEQKFRQMDPAKAMAFASWFQRQYQPVNRILVDPNTGNMYGVDRKRPMDHLPAPLNSAGPPPPLDTSIPIKEPVAGGGETPKDFLNRKNALRAVGSPNQGWEFDPEVFSGSISPPAKKELDDARKITTAASTGLDYGERLTDFLTKHPNGFPAGTDATAAQGWQTGLQTMVRTANDMGVYRPAEQPMINKATSDPTTLRAILSSAVGIHDLRTELDTLMTEMRQRAWVANQQAHIHPTADNTRWAGFKPVVAGQPSRAGRMLRVNGKLFKEGPNGEALEVHE